MNKIESKFNFKTLLMFLTVLVLSLSMVFATACNNGESTPESTSTSESESESESVAALPDNQVIANGDFEHPTNKTLPVTLGSSSSTYKWAASFDGDSGFQFSSDKVTRAIIDTAKDQTEAKYQEKEGDTLVNPGTPFSKGLIQDNADTEMDEDGTRILMLHNKKYAAQYVTSSTSLTVPAGEFGILKAWVRTSQLDVHSSSAGAYIKVKHNVSNPTVEDTTYDPLVIEGINTAGVWTEYTIYLLPNQNKTTTFTVVLGLGEGNSKGSNEKLARGYAYFDNVSFELKAYNEETVTALTPPTASVQVTTSTEKPEELVLSNEGRVAGSNKVVALSLNEGYRNDVDPNATIKDLTLGGSVTATEGVTLAENELAFDFRNIEMGSAYTHIAGDPNSQDNVYTLAPNSYARISFWAKIEAKDYQTKATMEIYDVVSEKAVATFANVSTDGYENENTDGFARYTFYVANNFDEDMTYQIKLTFGPTEDAISTTDPKAFPTGTATFKGFEIEELTKENYELADITTDTRAKKGSLLGKYDSDFAEEEDEEENEDNDSYNVTVTGYGKTLVEEGEIVDLTHLSSSNLTSSVAGSAVIGVVNSKNTYSNVVDGVETYADINAALEYVQGRLDANNASDNKYVQALLVKNISGNNLVSGNIVNVAANSTYIFSVKVYAHASAEAFVRLTEICPDSKNEALPKYETVIKNDLSVWDEDNEIYGFKSGFATVTFIITTGFESYDVKLEFGVQNAGVALFQSIVTGTINSTYVTGEATKNAFDSKVYSFKGEVLKPVHTYHYANEEDASKQVNHILDDDNNPLCDVSATKEISYTYATLKTLPNSTTPLLIYNRLNLNDRYTIDVTEEEEEESEEESTTESVEGGENYGWLQVTSIIIALVLVAALIAVVVRKAAEGKNKKKSNTEKYYQGFNKNKFSKSNDVAVPDEDEIAKDYDYENPENN